MTVKQYTDLSYSWWQNIITLYEDGVAVSQKKVAYPDDEYDNFIEEIERQGYELAFNEDAVEQARQFMTSAENDYVFKHKRRLMKREE